MSPTRCNRYALTNAPATRSRLVYHPYASTTIVVGIVNGSECINTRPLGSTPNWWASGLSTRSGNWLPTAVANITPCVGRRRSRPVTYATTGRRATSRCSWGNTVINPFSGCKYVPIIKMEIDLVVLIIIL